MKICPKCNSTFTDETLNFCLTDGEPLVAEDLLEEYLSSEKSSSWQNAKTLVDRRIPDDFRHTTASNEASPTTAFSTQEAKNIVPQSNKFLYSIIAVLLAAILAFGGYWWFIKNPNGNNSFSANNNQTFAPKRAIIELTEEQQTQVIKEVTDFLESWRSTNEKKDADAHIAHYANVLEIYYGESGKDKNHVLADRLRAYKKYDLVLMQIDNLKIMPESIESATVVFDKSWTMKNVQKTSTGSVQQEMHISKQNGKWLIDTEKDLKVYFINNRETANANSNNSAENKK
jgi:hypothetical protein